MSPLVPGSSSFHFWIHILGCRRKSSFQDCYGKSNALGNFWNWHIHPHLVSRNKSPGQGRRSREKRTLQTRDSPCLSPPDARPISRLSHFFSVPLQLGMTGESILADCMQAKGWHSFQTVMSIDCRNGCHPFLLPVFAPWDEVCATQGDLTTPLLKMWPLGQQPLTLAGL